MSYVPSMVLSIYVQLIFDQNWLQQIFHPLEFPPTSSGWKLLTYVKSEDGMSVSEYCFTSLSAQSCKCRDRSKSEAGTMPYSYFEWLEWFFIVHSTMGNNVHSMPLNSLEHYTCTTTMTNVRPDQDSNLIPPGYKPQSIQMSYMARQHDM